MHYFYRSGMALAVTVIGSLSFQAMFQGVDAAVLARSSEVVRPSSTYKYEKRYDAYDPRTPDKCVIEVENTKGGWCQTFVQCNNPSNKDVDPAVSYAWDVCRLNYPQYFYHEQVGNFSAVFTQAGDINDGWDGLLRPVIALEAYNDWSPLVIDDQIQLQEEGKWGKGNLCESMFDRPINWFDWRCGFPKLQKASSSAFGITLMYKDSDKPDYTPGRCTVHVTQYQRNEYGNGGEFAFAVQIYDGAGDQIGHVQKAQVDSDGHLSVFSKLPLTLVLDTGRQDVSPVHFSYGTQSWSCGSGDFNSPNKCTLGNGKAHGYENGDRSGDMGFDC
ncbi:hypothetical protein GGR54DRAFT_237918 [Hypoxylon sp. NC1633]|nr:hypothetical protein GGR54DRAFT_237918 [Hypoxylon sp. NC1633]